MTETDLSELTQFYDIWCINTPRNWACFELGHHAQ